MGDAKPKLGLMITMNEVFAEEDDFSIVSHPSSPEETENGPYSHLEHLKFPLPSVISESQQQMLEIQTQLRDILQENNDLRDALSKNNATLQEQFTTLSLWRDQTLRSQARHRQMIEDSCHINQQLKLDKDAILKDKIKLLEDMEHQKSVRDAREAQLEDDLEKTRKTCADLEERIEHLQRDVERNLLSFVHAESTCQELQLEIAQLKIENGKLFNQNSVIVEQLERQSTAQQEMNRMEHTESILTTEDEMGYAVIHNPCHVYPSREALEEQDLMNRFNLEEQRTSDLQETIKQQRAQLDEYEYQFANTRKEASNWEARMIEQIVQKHQLSSITTAPSMLQSYQDRCETVGQQLGVCQERLESLQLEEDSKVLSSALKVQVEELGTLLKQEREDKATDKENLEESRRQIEQLSCEYRCLLAKWETYELEQLSKGRQNDALTAISNRQHQEQLDEVTAKVVTLEEETHVKNSEIDRLKGQIALLQRDSEQLPILRAQVEVYQQDFNSEKEARLKAQLELENRRQEINNLHAQLIQLTDDVTQQSQQQILVMASNSQQQQPQQQQQSATATRIETFTMPRSQATRVARQSHAHQNSNSDSRSRRSTETRTPRRSHEPIPETVDPSGLFQCPSCRLAYTTIEGVQNHLDHCLGPDSPYP